jgi:uncharacterized membrane protein
VIRLHVLLLLMWIAAGAALRFANLDAKPLWTDELSTIAFSLGHGFRGVPLGRAISGDELLAPLRPSPAAALGAVAGRLAAETNHPPLFFLLSHLWLRLAAEPGVVVSAWAARALPASIGVASIPAVFALAWVALRSPGAAQVAAALAAFSPFGVYLAQEARHYSLAALLITASLAGFAAAARAWREQTAVSGRLCAGWIAANALGVAAHFLVTLVLAAQALAFAALLLRSRRARGAPPAAGGAGAAARGRRLALVAVSTLAAVVVWLPAMRSRGGGELLAWLDRGPRGWHVWLDPIGVTVAAATTMLGLLPVQAASPVVARVSAVALAVLAVAGAVAIARGLRRLGAQPGARAGLGALGGFAVAAIGLLLAITYLSGKAVAAVFRYHVVHFPAVLALAGGALAQVRRAPAPAIVAGLLGAITVVADLGYQKTHRPDLVAAAILAHSAGPVLVAIPYHTHGETGRLMGIELALRRARAGAAGRAAPAVHYLLARDSLAPSIAGLPRPLDLWLVNVDRAAMARLGPALRGCGARVAAGAVDGYRYRAFRCEAAAG